MLKFFVRINIMLIKAEKGNGQTTKTAESTHFTLPLLDDTNQVWFADNRCK
jgi:hypothetical protein